MFGTKPTKQIFPPDEGQDVINTVLSFAYTGMHFTLTILS